ncbi:tetratricopeptide repeat protein [Bacillus sp. JJ1566]|uniref:tetratricopeptide repeat protein n=1 Tax=Bacillus sp. JJ1566 TaxID=3122961 RepID=UPI0030000035
MSLFSFNHDGKFIFTNDPDHIFPKRKAFLENLGCETLEDYYYLAETYHFLEEYNKSIKLLTESIEKYEDPELYRLLGQSNHFKGNREEALSNFKKSLFLSETSAKTNRYMADLLRSMKDYEGSIYFYKQSLNLLQLGEDGYINDSFHEYNFFGLAIAYSNINQYKKVIEVANEFLFLSGIDWENFKERVLRVRSGKLKDRNVESQIYTTSTIYEILSIAYIELDNLDKAEEYISRAKWLVSDNIDIARVEGIIIGKRSSDQKLQEYKKLLETLLTNAEQRLFEPMEKISESVEEIKKNVGELNKESTTDFLELKPNFMGVGLNINEVINKLLKKKKK